MRQKTNSIKHIRNNVVIYARFSSSSQTEQSIEGQLRDCKEFAKRNEYNVIGTYIDRAISGTTDDRPEFQKMIADSEKGLFDYVLVWKLDRFSRDKYDNAFYKKKLADNNIRVISATENFGDGPEAEILESLMESWAQYYVKDLKLKVKRGIRESHIKGLYPGGKLLFGYDLKDRKLYINEFEANIVKEIFTDVSNGKLFKDIASSLNDRGIKPKNVQKWTNSSIQKMTSNPRYTGVVEFEDGIYDNIYPKIVDQELFEACDITKTSNKKRAGHYNTDIDYLLSGKIFCAFCGSYVNGEYGTGKGGKRYFYYKCSLHKKDPKACACKTYKKDLLEDFVVDKTIDYILQPKLMKKLAHEMVLKFNELLNPNNDIKNLKSEKLKVENKINNMMNVIQNGLFTDSMKESLLLLEEQKANLEKQIIDKELTSKDPLDVEDCYAFLNSIATMDLTNELNKKFLIERFVRKIILGDDRIKIQFYPVDKPYLFDTIDAGFNGGSNNTSNSSNSNDGNSEGSKVSTASAISPPFDFVDEHPTLEYVDWLLTLSINLEK